MKQMTKNEYSAHIKKCAKRFENEPDYSLAKFNADLESVEVLPFDLSAFPQLTGHTVKWINALFKEEEKDKNGNYMLRGFTYHEISEMNVLGLHSGDFGRSLSFWAYSDEQYLLYTFCEGDTTLQIFSDKETYEKEKAITFEWYKEAS